MQKKKDKIPRAGSKLQYLLNDHIALVEGDEDESNPNFKISYKYYNSNLCETPAPYCLHQK